MEITLEFLLDIDVSYQKKEKKNNIDEFLLLVFFSFNDKVCIVRIV